MRARWRLSPIAALLAAAACAGPGESVLPTDRGALRARLASPGAECRVYADFGSVPHSTTFVEVLPEGETDGRGTLEVREGTLGGNIDWRPVRLRVGEREVTGSMETDLVRFAIEAEASETTVRAGPGSSLSVTADRMSLVTPGAAFEAKTREPGWLEGPVKVASLVSTATVRTGGCDLAYLRANPYLLALLLAAFEQVAAENGGPAAALARCTDCGKRWGATGTSRTSSQPARVSVSPARQTVTRPASSAPEQRSSSTSSPPAGPNVP